MEACSNFQKTANPPAQFDTPPRRLRDAAENLQQGRLARSVPPDQSDDFSRLDIEGHVTKRPEFLDRVKRVGCIVARPKPTDARRQHIPQSCILLRALVANT